MWLRLSGASVYALCASKKLRHVRVGEGRGKIVVTTDEVSPRKGDSGNQSAQFLCVADRTRHVAVWVSFHLTASIGRGLLPTLQFATKVTRGFADVVFTLSGPVGRLTDSVLKPLGSVFDTLVSTVGNALAKVAVATATYSIAVRFHLARGPTRERISPP